MNDQLLSHLETFDSDAEFSATGSPASALRMEEHTVGMLLREMGMNLFDKYLLQLNNLLGRIYEHASFKEVIIRFVWLLPIGIAFGDYVGLLWSMTLSLICLLVSLVQPESHHRRSHHLHEEMTGHEEYHQDHHPLNVCEISVVNQTSTTTGTSTTMDGNTKFLSEEQVQDCRIQISRLLGIIGAPPLDWSDPPNTDLNNQQQQEQSLISASESATILVVVVQFLEAHVQFLLAVDETYRWLQVSASLHLGLGPRSQCVERVERASMAREFRNQTPDENMNSDMEPQRGLCKSILSLSMVRHHLAKAMVDQSDSIMQVLHCSQQDLEISQRIPPSHTDNLEIPLVVDLLWIKRARNHLAVILSDTVDAYCTRTNSRAKLTTTDDTVRSMIETSVSNARIAREYLVSNLLLGKRRPTYNPLPNPNDPLLLSLMQFREQVDALSGAIWSCQQYTATTTKTTSDCEQQQESIIVGVGLGGECIRIEWWTRIQQLTETMRTMESEIGQRFFAIPTTTTADGQDNDDGEEQVPCAALAIGSAEYQEHKTYQREDDGWNSPSTENKSEDQKLPSKTLVFKGHGAKHEGPKHSATKRGGMGTTTTTGSTEGPLALPPRDTMSERQMIRELQNRISLMRQPEVDEEEQDEPETEAAMAARMGRAPSEPLFLGASGSLLSELRQTILLAPATSSRGEEQQVHGQ